MPPELGPDLECETRRAGGCEYALWQAGDGPVVWCLHGFPDTAATWQTLAPDLLAAGYRVCIPAMPGYAPSGPLADGDYSVPALARSLLALMQTEGDGGWRIVGHDWGAVCAYALAALAPQRIERIVAAAVPHPRRFLAPSAGQLRRSWYMGYFQLPRRPERRLPRDDFAFVERLWQAWSPGWAYRPKDIAPVKACLAEPGVSAAVLAYYRALPRALLSPWRSEERRRLLAPLATPTLAVAGAQDGCIGPEMFRGQESCFDGPYRLCELPQAGHFMHREQPGRFAREVLDWLA